MTYILFAIGMAGLFFGGEFLVRGASAIARHANLSPMVIGLTIVGFGTSAPELLVSVEAALAGQPSIALGSALGSNIANVLLILGFSALAVRLLIPVRRIWRDLGFMLLATFSIWFMLLDGSLSRIEGILLLIGLVVFLGVAVLFGDPSEVEEDPMPNLPLWRAALLAIGGLATLAVGARLLVDSATEIARALGVTEAVIGLTIVAVGTSLPELATSIVAAFRKQADIAVGNVIGSNIFNLFGILGITAVIIPIPAEPRFAMIDMPWVAGTAVGLVLVAALLGALPRIGGVILLAIYAGYVALMN